MEPPDDCPVRLSSLGALSVLPDYLLNLILLQLEDEADLARTACASRVLRVLCCEEPLWIWFCFKNHDGKISFLANWRQTALHQLRSRLSLGSATTPPGVKHPDDHAITAAAQPLPPVPGLQSMFLYRRWCRRYMDVSGFLPPPVDSTAGPAGPAAAQGFPVERLDVRGLSPAAFAQRFDEGCLPALLLGAMEDWAGSEWTFDSMLQSYGDTCFSVARPTSGQAPMLLRDYVDYMRRQADEEPLYIFDPGFVESAPRMGRAYTVPGVFDQDLLALLGTMRPHFRWLVAGPVRSGASWHVDPSLTSAWNALLNGRKRWLLYPPHVVPQGVMVGSDDTLTSLQWLLEVYPLLPPDKKPMELVQSPGEVVFVPGGWWHCVLNLEPSVAVTQNFASRANLRRVLRHMSHGSEHYHDHVGQYYEPSVVRGWNWDGPQEDSSGSDSEEDCEGHREDPNDKAKSDSKGWAGRANKRAGGGAREGVTKHPRVAAAAATAAAAAGVDGDGQEGGVKAPGGGSEAAARDVERRLGVPVLQLKARVAASPPPEPAGSLGGRQGGRARGGGGSGGECGEEGSCGLSAGALKMQRKKQLGHWLRKLWVHEPELRTEITSCMEEFLAGPGWQQLLSTVCTALSTRRSGAEPGAAQQVAGGPLQPPGALGGGEGDDPTAPWGLSCLPLCGVSSLVYLSGDVAIKFITEEDSPLANLMCAMEVTCSSLLHPQRSPSPPAAPASSQLLNTPTAPSPQAPGPRHWRVPAVLACGLVDVEETCSSAAQPPDTQQQQQQQGQRQRQQIPFVVTERVDPSSLPLSEALSGLSKDEKLEAAAALGRLLGQLHLLGHATCAGGVPLPLPALTIRAGSADGIGAPADALGWLAELLPGLDGGAEGGKRWVWHNRHGSIWTSRSTAGGESAGTGAAWEPFVSYLRSRRTQAAYDLEAQGALPPWLMQQVEAFLPQDPATLLGFISVAAAGDGSAGDPAAPGGSGTALTPASATPPTGQPPQPAALSAAPELGLPWLLHGDLLPGNILASFPPPTTTDSAPRLQLSVLDFADAGHGDPLYDLMVLLGGCLELDPGLMKACWGGYREAVDVEGEWPHAAGAAPRSHRAMCYCMLHEEDVVLERALHKVEGAQEAAAAEGLLGLQRLLWGFLDE